MPFRYRQQAVSLLTNHGKERVIAPVLAQALGCRVLRVDGFDTDTLGSFSRETPRLTNALDTCRRKAEIGMGLAHTALGLASEGSFNADPWSGLLPWNVEILVFIDAQNGWEIVGTAQGPAHNHAFTATDWASLSAQARQYGFPAHQLCLRPSSADDLRVIKGIDSWDGLKRAFDTCLQRSDRGLVHAESELRAFGNPTRMATHAVWRCACCQHSHEAAMAQSNQADPSRCDHCNP